MNKDKALKKAVKWPRKLDNFYPIHLCIIVHPKQPNSPSPHDSKKIIENIRATSDERMRKLAEAVKFIKKSE